jgi:hypothetical protein
VKQRLLVTVRRAHLLQCLPTCWTNPIEFRRLVYYRLYTKDGAIQSINPIYSNDPFISRILPIAITPPRTALSLKKHLCEIERVAGLGSNALLFEALASDAAIPDSTRLKLRGYIGSGVSSREPMALVVGVPEVEKRSSGPDPQAKELCENPDPHETRYSMYRSFIVILGHDRL